jgi:uncharacterized protein YuzE
MKPKMVYLQDDDVIHVTLAGGPEHGSVELSPHVTAEINADGDLIGIEILRASEFMRDSVLESVQARLLRSRPSARPLLRRAAGQRPLRKGPSKAPVRRHTRATTVARSARG